MYLAVFNSQIVNALDTRVTIIGIIGKLKDIKTLKKPLVLKYSVLLHLQSLPEPLIPRKTLDHSSSRVARKDTRPHLLQKEKKEKKKREKNTVVPSSRVVPRFLAHRRKQDFTDLVKELQQARPQIRVNYASSPRGSFLARLLHAGKDKNPTEDTTDDKTCHHLQHRPSPALSSLCRSRSISPPNPGDLSGPWTGRNHVSDLARPRQGRTLSLASRSYSPPPSEHHRKWQRHHYPRCHCHSDLPTS